MKASLRTSIPFIYAILVALVPLYVSAQDIPDTFGNRLMAAQRYLDVVSMEDMMHDMVNKTAENYPENIRATYVALMNQHFRIEILERAVLASMARHFTVKELDALASFYGSKEGKSAMKKFGAYMADIMPVIQQEVIRAQKGIQSDLEKGQ